MKKEVAEKETIKAADSKDYVELRLPKLSFRNGPINAYLVVALVIFSFLLGMLTSKVMYLEKQGKTTGATDTTATAQVAAPTGAQPTPAGPFNVSVGNFPVKGDTNAKVTVIEFADLRCPFCEKWFTDTESNLIKDYVDTGKVKFAFRNYAFLGPASTLAANAAECANEQDKFWEFHDYMYKNQPDESDTSMYTVDNLSQIAGTLGMDQTQFNSCLSSNKYDKNVSQDLTDGQSATVDGTPTTFVNGVPLVGAVPYAQLKQQIDSALAAAK